MLKVSSRSLIAFEEYCKMGPERSLAKLCVALGKTPGYTRQLQTWSSREHWFERAREYDIEQIKERQRQNMLAIDVMNNEHVTLADELAAKALNMIAELEACGKFTAAAAIQLLRLSIDLKRVALGADSTQIAALHNSNDTSIMQKTSELTDEELLVIVQSTTVIQQKRIATNIVDTE